METVRIIGAVVMFAAAVVVAVGSLYAGADGRYRSIGWASSLATFGAALWAALSLL